MTYCVGLLLDAGIVCLSDTRTNAGVDNISVYRKMFHFETPGERIVTVMCAGSLSTTQTTLARLSETAEDPDAAPENSILACDTMLGVAEIVGRTLSAVYGEIAAKVGPQGPSAGASLIVAGQRAGGAMRMFLVYTEGNFIEATEDTPFLQVGEHKYGKPLLDRVIRPDTTLEDAEKAVLLSMDSTIRSNLSVGMPLDLAVIAKDALTVTRRRRIEPDDPAFADMSRNWSEKLREAFASIRLG